MAGKERKDHSACHRRKFARDWATCIESVNSMVADLVQPTNEMARVIGAVAKGDFRKPWHWKIDGRSLLQGEFLRSAKLVNGMVGQLRLLHLK